MKLLFWNKQEAKKQQAAQLEREAAKIHQKNISKIADTKQKVDKLNVVLKQNNIVFQLAHVIGQGHNK